MLKALVAAVLLALATGCVSTSTPTTPAVPVELTGTWRGNLVLSDQTVQMAWTLTSASGGAISGPALVTQPNGIVLANGFLTGTLSGTTLSYTISIGAGGLPAFPACVGQLGGSASASIGPTSTLTGTYTLLSSTCPTPFTSGTFTLTR